MTLKSLFISATLLLASPAAADPAISIEGGYATAAGATAIAGAAYFVINNTGPEDDRLVAVESAAARRVGLHETVSDGAVMGMRPLDDGIAVPAGGVHRLETGGDHVMLMGLTEPLREGATVALTLVFEKAGAVEVQVPVVSGPVHGGGMDGMTHN